MSLPDFDFAPHQGMMLFSRSGKSSNNMFRAFHKKPKANVVSTLAQNKKNEKPPPIKKYDEDKLVGYAEYQSRDKTKDVEDQQKPKVDKDREKSHNELAQQMREIEIKNKQLDLSEIQKVRWQLKQKKGKGQQVTDKEVQLKILENGKRNLSANFVSTSRERRQFIQRNKTNAPEVGKYTPNTQVVSKNTLQFDFSYDHEFSKQAKLNKVKLDFENRKLCKQLVKGICTHHTHENQTSEMSGEDQIQPKRKTSRLQSPIAFKEQLEAGIQKKVGKGIRTLTANCCKKSARGNNKVVGHMPNGHTIEYETRDLNRPSLSNHKSRSLAYKAFFQTQNYHIIQGAKGPEHQDILQIETNDHNYKDSCFSRKYKGRDMDSYSKRKPINGNSLNEKRFNTIIGYQPQNSMSISFHKQIGRQDRFETIGGGPEYDDVHLQKDKLLPRTGGGTTKFKKQSQRVIGKGFGGFYRHKNDLPPPISVCDNQRMQVQHLNKHKSQGLTTLASQKPRDMLMYKTTNLLTNIQLENTKHEREAHIQKEKTLRLKNGQQTLNLENHIVSVSGF